MNRDKWAEVSKKLRKALGDDNARFSRVFLIDDFVGSGKTLLRWEEEESQWDGKLVKFWNEGQRLMDDGQTVFASHLESSWSLYVHHYIASAEGRSNAEAAHERARRERPAEEWFNHVEFTFGLVFDPSLPLQEERDAAMWALTEQVLRSVYRDEVNRRRGRTREARLRQMRLACGPGAQHSKQFARTALGRHAGWRRNTRDEAAVPAGTTPLVRPMENPFHKRATEHLRDADAFLAMFSPDPLQYHLLRDSAGAASLYDRLLVMFGQPEAAKR